MNCNNIIKRLWSLKSFFASCLKCYVDWSHYKMNYNEHLIVYLDCTLPHPYNHYFPSRKARTETRKEDEQPKESAKRGKHDH